MSFSFEDCLAVRVCRCDVYRFKYEFLRRCIISTYTFWSKVPCFMLSFVLHGPGALVFVLKLPSLVALHFSLHHLRPHLCLHRQLHPCS